MARLCEVCRADLDELGKRPQALTCGGACRAEKSRRQRRTSGGAPKAHRKRTRRVREGVSVYLPTLRLAEALAGVLDDYYAASDDLRQIEAAVAAAIERRRARG